MDLQRLNKIIEDSGITKVALAKKLRLSPQGLYFKLNGKNDFTREEVGILCDVLRITDLAQKEAIFFSREWT